MPGGVRPRAVNRQVLTDRVYEEVLAGLMDGRFTAGAGISIDGLARDLDVSPTPVREALARLESTGMVTRVALKGYRVAPLFTTEELGELMDARLVLEPVTAMRACERATPELVAELARSVADLRDAPRGGSFAEFRDYWEADERLHRLIAEHSGNRFLLSAYEGLGGQIQRFRYFNGVGVTDAEAAIEEHTAILAAFRTGAAHSVGEAMVAHLAGVKARALGDVRSRDIPMAHPRR
ncbi:GntR family transcriptional regulator [Nakamurella flavida]|uniref:GntR family transcriptional regulator n=1 Tax=Nakamurella flavida TaxID=363630 RepID=A0A938YJB4_9ACTN|nr:GntR family transcriptional regulator [Nakamurella flavida]MBM9475646.1 GntR family transcriptional regulator [Nakamurella flavida]MDP9778078.1 DNA-binding GntR family transcriptional regulator [Nakamurella flavida]